jgi:feruloyl esterase
MQGGSYRDRRTFPVLFITFPASLALAAIPAAAQQSPENLASVKFPNVTITSANYGEPGFELPAQNAMMKIPPRKVKVPFCRIQAFSAPTSDSHIGIEVWLPTSANWNGKFLAAGNPGFIGRLSSGGLAGIMETGYDDAGTDTGHVDADMNSGFPGF